MLHFSEAVPVGLYVHIPWCVRKCPYCDFNSHEARGNLPERAYVDALLADLEQDAPRIAGRSITSIFIGGGTPSLFSAEAIERLLGGMDAWLQPCPDREITLEANPGTVDQAKFTEFREAGINRLSIGIQSFSSDHLARLGRIHGRRDAFQAAEAAHTAGFGNVNLDLMFGLPEQTVAQALADLANAVALEPGHISHYQLTLEPNTLFFKHPPALPDEDAIWEMQERCRQRLSDAGYQHYEVSAHARPGKCCRHNLNYWRFGDYLGIGAGAHGKITDTLGGTIHRLYKRKHPRDYLRADTAALRGHEERVPTPRIPFEFMLNALRLVEGVPTALFSERTGLPIDSIAGILGRARDRGLLETWEEVLRPTELGRRFLNDLIELFLPEMDYA